MRCIYFLLPKNVGYNLCLKFFNHFNKLLDVFLTSTPPIILLMAFVSAVGPTFVETITAMTLKMTMKMIPTFVENNCNGSDNDNEEDNDDNDKTTKYHFVDGICLSSGTNLCKKNSVEKTLRWK